MNWWSTDDPRRLAAVVAVLLGATAVVGLGVGLLLGLAGDGGSPPTVTPRVPSATGTTTSPSQTPATSPPSPTARAASQIEPGTRRDVGYLVASRRAGDGVHATFDRVIFRTGQAARDYARRYHKHRPGADGVLIVNDNELTRDLVLSPDVTVLGTRALAGTPTPSEVTLGTLRDAIDSQGDRLLLDLRYDQLGYVTEVAEHDLP